jgi:hypothetical protein
MASEKTADRKAVMEKFKHPENLPVPVLAEPERKLTLQTTPKLACEGEARESNTDHMVGRDESHGSDSRGGQNTLPAPGTDDGPRGAQISDDGPKTDTGAEQPSRDEVVKETVAVLKKLCSAPRYTNQVRKELRRQGVVK